MATAHGPLAVLRRRPRLRVVILGLTASRLGDAFNAVALAWLVLDVGEPRDLGLLFLAAGIPRAFSAPLAGHLLDHFGLRTTLIADNLIRGALITIIPVLALTGELQTTHLYPIVFLAGVVSSVTDVGQEIVVPLLVDDDELDSANALLATTFDLSEWVGPVLAGLSVQAFGIEPALILNAVTFFVMALAATAVPRRSPQTQHDASDPPSTIAGLFRGFSLLWGLRPVFALTVMGVGVLLVDGALQVFWPTYTKEMLHSGPAAYGLLVSLAGVGSLVGTLILSPLIARLRSSTAVVLTVLLPAPALLPLAFVDNLAAAGVFAALFAMLAAPFYPISRSIMQRQVPEHLRGRVFGARVALNVWGFPFGAATGGLLLSAFGVGDVIPILVAAHLPMIAIALWAASSMTTTQSPPTAEASAASPSDGDSRQS